MAAAKKDDLKAKFEAAAVAAKKTKKAASTAPHHRWTPQLTHAMKQA